ncbi:MAG: hypothetical protein ACK502_06500 [Alphaproteobacteria bacterium]
MRIPALVPAAFCVVAGVLLSGDAVIGYFSSEGSSFGSSDKFDIFSFAVGLYFIGKGLFIRSVLHMLCEFKNR